MKNNISRRQLIAGAAAGAVAVGNAMGAVQPNAKNVVPPGAIDEGLNNDLDPIKTKLVMNLVVTCSSPESWGGATNQSKDGIRRSIWPILGGYFYGPGIRGEVLPGGADYPVERPDGVVIVDALYRLRTNDGVSILILDKGLAYGGEGSDRGWGTYRLTPVFTAPVGKYDWLNKSIFLANLVETPVSMRVAKGPDENDRLIQVFRVF